MRPGTKYSPQHVANKTFNEDAGAMDVNNASKTAGEDIQNDVLRVEERMLAYPGITASGVVLATPGRIKGIFVSAASATPTIKVWDNSAGSGAVCVDTFTPVAGTMYNFGVTKLNTACYITIGGTVNCTVFARPDNA